MHRIHLERHYAERIGWLRASMFRSARRRTPRRQISNANARNLKRMMSSSARSWRRSTKIGVWTRLSRNRSSTS